MTTEVTLTVQDAASRILILTGLIQILWGLITGIPMGMLRMNGKEVPRYLTLAHMGGLMQGPLLMGMVFAIQLSELSSGWETAGAGTIAAASLMLVLKDTLNWGMGIDDEFRQKPVGYWLGVALGPMYVLGVSILVVGAFGGLLA